LVELLLRTPSEKLGPFWKSHNSKTAPTHPFSIKNDHKRVFLLNGLVGLLWRSQENPTKQNLKYLTDGVKTTHVGSITIPTTKVFLAIYYLCPQENATLAQCHVLVPYKFD
jgi:hypothetical protein